MQTLEGTQLGNYDVIRRIRIGGMGAVYEGRQRTAFGRRVAIKVILGNFASDREMRRRFAREARTIAQLHHPHILQLIEFGDERGLLYLVMPFIEGGTLTDYLRRELPDLRAITTIFLQLLDAVGYAHEEGLIHRDIKSSNVLLDARRGGAPYIYLADFGLVRTAQNLELEEIGQPIPLDQIPGTPHYMAPEQARGIVTPLTDIYALGVLLYQMLTGELPYDDPDDIEVAKMHLYAPVPSPCESDASIPLELGEVVRVAMAKRPDQRFSNVADMRKAFLAAVEGPIAHTTEDDPHIDMLAVKPRPPRRPSQQLPPRLPQRRATRQLPPNEQPQAAIHRREAIVNRQPAGAFQPPQPPPRPRARNGTPALPSTHLRDRRATRKSTENRRGRFALLVSAVLLVPILLVALVILPRAFGISLFPVGFPLVGAAPGATISVTLKSRVLANSYLLMASPQITSADVSTRAIPDRQLTVTLSASREAATSGTQNVAGAQASGQVWFDNSSHRAYTEVQGTQFKANDGVLVMLSQTVTIPPSQNGVDGTISVQATAVNQGASGNIPAEVLYTTCCNSLVIVSNPQPFSGGVDPRLAHIVTQADINGAQASLTSSLQKSAGQKLQAQLATGEVEAAQPAYQTKGVASLPVGALADTVAVQVTLTASVMAYNVETARQVTEELLLQQEVQQLGGSYQLENMLNVAQPVVTTLEAGGVIYLSVHAQGLWLYRVTPQQLEQWKQSIKGATPQLAQTYITSQSSVASVHIQLSFGEDHLPDSINQIQIVLVSV